jgi:hypothetical protein
MSLPLIIQLCYAVFCVGLAWVNWYVINKGLRVYHAINGAIHIAAAVYLSIAYWWLLGIALLCTTNVVFSVALNLFRGKRINYISPSPASKIDKIEKQIFGNDFYAPKAVYLLTSIVINIVYFIFIN